MPQKPSGADPAPRKPVVAGDRNTGEPGDKLNKIKRRRDETPRDKPVEEEGDKDIRDQRGLRR